MKRIDIDDELYHYIASRTQSIGETASDILRRLLRLPASPQPFVLVQEHMISELKALAKQPITKSDTLKETKVNQNQLIFPPSKQLEDNFKDLFDSDNFKQESKTVNRFLMILAILYQYDPLLFSQASLNIQGSERIYFAKDEQSILATGSGVRAKQIPNSPFWVITNNNTSRKGLILKSLMVAMQLPQSLIEQIECVFG